MYFQTALFQQVEDHKSMPPQDSYIEETQENTQNNMLIMQYESVLQNVNREFQKLLNKNKETEEELNMTKMKLEQTQKAYEDEVNMNQQNAGMFQLKIT